MSLNRRSLITGIVSLIAAPAIVRGDSLMRVSGDTYRIWQYRAPLLPPILGLPERTALDIFSKLMREKYLGPNGQLFEGTWTFFGKHHNIWADEKIAFTRSEYPA